MKGVELGTAKRMSEVVCEVAGVPLARVAVVSGPNLAREIAHEQPTATVVACTDAETCARLQAACTTPYFRPYTNPDVVGCELGGAVKNVIALATGMAEGMGFGDNTKASLMTRGLAETARLGARARGRPDDLRRASPGSATSSRPAARRCRATAPSASSSGAGCRSPSCVRGRTRRPRASRSCRSVLDLAEEHGVEMPITEQVVAVCHEGRSPRDVIAALMGRQASRE